MAGRWKLVTMAVVLGLLSARAEAAGPQELVQAQTGTFETIAVKTNTASVGNLGPNSVIYGFKLVADDAADQCGLYDDDAIDVGGFGTEALQLAQGRYIDELSEATDNAMRESDWPAPYKLVTDLTVLTNGMCTVYVDVQ